MSPTFGNALYTYNWDGEEDASAFRLDHRVGPEVPKQSQQPFPKNDIYSVPLMPPDEILSPPFRQSMKSIRRLTGNFDSATGALSGAPTLHHSPQKIKQLTGLDIGVNGSIESQLRASRSLQNNAPPVSATSSIYSQEVLEATPVEPDRDCSGRFRTYGTGNDKFNGLVTPFRTHRCAASLYRPVRQPSVSQTWTAARPRLLNCDIGDLEHRGPGGWLLSSSKYQSPPSYSDRADDPETSSSDGSSNESVVDLYHSSANEIARYSTAAWESRTSPTRGERPILRLEKCSKVWKKMHNGGQSVLRSIQHRSNFSSPSPPLSASDGSLYPQKASFSDGRAVGRNHDISRPLESSRATPPPQTDRDYSSGQRASVAPLPWPSESMKSAFEDYDDEAGGDRKHFSILSKVFGGRNGNSSSSSRRGSRGAWSMQSWKTGPKERRRRRRRRDSSRLLSRSAHGFEWPNRSWLGLGGGGCGSSRSRSSHKARPASSSPGMLQRKMESARQTLGLKSVTERRRESIRDKIRVFRGDELRGGAAEMTRLRQV